MSELDWTDKELAKLERSKTVETKHKMKVVSSHDVNIWCSCGKWSFITTGPLTPEVRKRAKGEHKFHLEYIRNRERAN